MGSFFVGAWVAEDVGREIVRDMRESIGKAIRDCGQTISGDSFSDRKSASVGHQFKVGDLVECVDNGDGFSDDLTVGCLYRVTEVLVNGVYFKSDLGETECCFASRFKLAYRPGTQATCTAECKPDCEAGDCGTSDAANDGGHGFRVGEVIECVNDREGCARLLTIGKAYEVIEVDRYDSVIVKADDGKELSCYAWRFKKVAPEDPVDDRVASLTTDLVKCVDNSGYEKQLTVGKTYRIPLSPGGVCAVSLDDGTIGYCSVSCFEKIKPPKPGPVSRFKVGDKVRCRDFSGSWYTSAPLDSETVYEVTVLSGPFVQIDGRFFYDEFRFELASEIADDTEDDSDGDAGEWPLELEVGESYVDRVGGVWEVVHVENEYECLDDNYDNGWKFLAVNYDARIHGWFREDGEWTCTDSDEYCKLRREDLVDIFDG